MDGHYPGRIGLPCQFCGVFFFLPSNYCPDRVRLDPKAAWDTPRPSIDILSSCLEHAGDPGFVKGRCDLFPELSKLELSPEVIICSEARLAGTLLSLPFHLTCPKELTNDPECQLPRNSSHGVSMLRDNRFLGPGTGKFTERIPLSH